MPVLYIGCTVLQALNPISKISKEIHCKGKPPLSPGQLFLDGIVHNKINKWTFEWLWYRRAHARLPRYGLPSLASLGSVRL